MKYRIIIDATLKNEIYNSLLYLYPTEKYYIYNKIYNDKCDEFVIHDRQLYFGKEILLDEFIHMTSYNFIELINILKNTNKKSVVISFNNYNEYSKFVKICDDINYKYYNNEFKLSDLIHKKCDVTLYKFLIIGKQIIDLTSYEYNDFFNNVPKINCHTFLRMIKITNILKYI